ncbi:MAG: AtpZ/AtpI family protein [Deltaproteobacteria bacterium]|jgi:ATP synthase protein I|nr:AtpZ/AtpI family protein [Deltaproteobacteria bacterium]
MGAFDPKDPGQDKGQGEKPSYAQFRALATASSMGLAVVISIFLGLGLGLLLDRHFGTKPWLMLAGLLLGVAAGFRNLWVMALRVERSQEKIKPRVKTPRAGSGNQPEGSGSGNIFVPGNPAGEGLGPESHRDKGLGDIREALGEKEFNRLTEILELGPPGIGAAKPLSGASPAQGGDQSVGAEEPFGRPTNALGEKMGDK